jgi:hypothetical protein
MQALVDELAAVRVGRASRSHRSSEPIRSRIERASCQSGLPSRMR